MAWAQHVRHPWFNPPTMKRKLFDDDDNDDGDYSDDAYPDVLPAAFSTGRRKRVRYDSLERTLAHMTLGNALANGPSEDVDMWPKISPPRSREQETLDVVLPSSVEEPSIRASDLVDMEVEPALVTTETPPPHGIADWAKIASGQLDIKEVQISRAVLDCIKRQCRGPPAPIPISSEASSQALVLYRTPPRPPMCGVVAREDDVMEVEP